jgi:hypothetical protein
LRSQFQSFLVTSETNQGYLLPWNRICVARPLWIRKSAVEYSEYLSATRRCKQGTIDTIAVQFEPCVIQDKVNPASRFPANILDSVPKVVEVVAKNVLLSCCEVLSASRLESLDLLLGHVYEQRKISRVTPQANYISSSFSNEELMDRGELTLGELKKHETLSLKLLLCRF